MSSVGDIAIIGFMFIGATVFFEKQERTIGAIVSTPLRFWEYLAAKLTVLVLISLFVAVTVATVADGFTLPPGSVGGRRRARHPGDAAGGDSSPRCHSPR